MITFKEYITEAPKELHPEIQNILDNTNLAPNSKRNAIVKTVRSIGKRGEDTGITGKMLKGSSRITLLHKDPHEVTIDGQKATIPTVTKFAHTYKNQRGTLESYIPEHFDHNESFGTRQNAHETDNFSMEHYSVLPKNKDGSFSSNHEGILPPMIDKDHENHSWIQMGHVKDVTAQRFKQLTKTPEFKKGISHQEFYDAVNREWNHSQGRDHYSTFSGDHLTNIVDNHPFVQKVLEYSANLGTHPADFVKQNMGEWHNPVTKTDHLVIRDSGASADLLNLYTKARRKAMYRY